MKTLILYRHTKSSWDNTKLKDFDRPLDARGKKDTKSQAKVLKKLKLKIDHYFVSPAKRTKKTFKPLIKALNIKRKKYTYNEELYECSGTDLKKFIKKLDENYVTVMIIGHNPSIEHFIKRNTIKKQLLIPPGTIVILSQKNSKFMLKKRLTP